jgi:hypothetical protein
MPGGEDSDFPMIDMESELFSHLAPYERAKRISELYGYDLG